MYSNDNKPDREEIAKCEQNRKELMQLRDLLINRYSYLKEFAGLYEEYKDCYNKLYSMVTEILKEDASDDIDGKLWAFTFSSRCDSTKLNPDQVENINQYINDFDMFNNEVILVIEEIEQAIADKEYVDKLKEKMKLNAEQANLVNKAHEAQEAHEVFSWKENNAVSEQMFMPEAFIKDDENQQQ